jgi:hypothetical protein
MKFEMNNDFIPDKGRAIIAEVHHLRPQDVNRLSSQYHTPALILCLHINAKNGLVSAAASEFLHTVPEKSGTIRPRLVGFSSNRACCLDQKEKAH